MRYYRRKNSIQLTHSEYTIALMDIKKPVWNLNGIMKHMIPIFRVGGEVVGNKL